MKYSSLPVKRRPVKKGALRTLYANIAGKRHRAAVAAMNASSSEVEGSVPNLGVARALIVILAIHVIAIAGIFIHSHFFEQRETAVATGPKLLEPASSPRDQSDDSYKLPKLSAGDSFYDVGTGDDYSKIARGLGVDQQELREANSHIELRPGLRIRVPAKISADRPDEAAMLRQVAEGETPARPTAAGVTPSSPAPDSLREAPPMVATTAAGSLASSNATRSALVHSDDSVLVRPTIRRETAGTPTPAPAASSEKVKEKEKPKTAAAEAPPARPTAMKGSYAVKSGDTFWRIAQAHGTTPEALMKANGIKDPSKLKIGMQLKVPAKK